MSTSSVSVDRALPGSSPPAPTVLPPVVLLGGEANALSVTRELGREGVKVYILCERDSVARHSRYCHWIELPDGGGGAEAQWSTFLLSPQADYLHGAVVLACSDAGLQVLAQHQEELKGRYLLDLCNPAAQVAMLDKLTTYVHAAAAGVPTPRFWDGATEEQVSALRGSMTFPVMVKPRLSHLFEKQFGRKHVIVSTFEQLRTTLHSIALAGLAVLLMEWVPGGDELLCSYYTYLDEAGHPLFHFTKRIVRRFPAGMGGASYHVTDWVPQIVEPANRLFAQVGLRGVANVEFKVDPRDGQYKLIECNARFTASNCLVSAAGCRIALFVYNRIVGRPLPEMTNFRWRMRLLDPVRDFYAFRELRGQGRIGVIRWLVSLLHRQTFAYFSWTDPMPAIVRLLKPFRKLTPRKTHGGAAAGETIATRGVTS